MPQEKTNNLTAVNDVYLTFNSDEEVNIEREAKQKQIQKNLELELVQERQKQFSQLENDIVDLNSMFKDLAIIVHDQGETIGFFKIHFYFINISLYYCIFNKIKTQLKLIYKILS